MFTLQRYRCVPTHRNSKLDIFLTDTYGVKEGVHYEGFFIYDPRIGTDMFQVKDLKDCINKCREFEGCKYFNYISKVDTFGECRLKIGMGKLVLNPFESDRYYFGHRNSKGKTLIECFPLHQQYFIVCLSTNGTHHQPCNEEVTE